MPAFDGRRVAQQGYLTDELTDYAVEWLDKRAEDRPFFLYLSHKAVHNDLLTDGTQEGTWILADYLDVVLHVFTPEAREFYKLEELWGDVPEVELETVAAG